MKAVIFDLDGVITDTAKYHFQAWKTLASAIGIQIDEIFNEQLKGISRMDSLERILKFGGRSADFSKEEKSSLAERKNEDYRKLITSMTPDDLLPGIQNFLNELKEAGIKIGLASASKNGPFILDALKITPFFDTIVDPAKLKKESRTLKFLRQRQHSLIVNLTIVPELKMLLPGFRPLMRRGFFLSGSVCLARHTQTGGSIRLKL